MQATSGGDAGSAYATDDKDGTDAADTAISTILTLMEKVRLYFFLQEKETGLKESAESALDVLEEIGESSLDALDAKTQLKLGQAREDLRNSLSQVRKGRKLL